MDRRGGGELCVWFAGARSVCGVWVGACACGMGGEAAVEDAGGFVTREKDCSQQNRNLHLARHILLAFM